MRLRWQLYRVAVEDDAAVRLGGRVEIRVGDDLDRAVALVLKHSASKRAFLEGPGVLLGRFPAVP